MLASSKCSSTGCIHWAWQEGRCKYHYANSRRARSPSLGSPYEYIPEIAPISSFSSTSTPPRRSSQSPDVQSSFDVKRLTNESSGEVTFTMIKPDAAERLNVVQAIAHRFMKEGFTILEYRKIHLSKKIATELYDVHKEKVWFSELLDYVTGGPSVIFVLKKENAIEDLRKLVGPTDPEAARKSDPPTNDTIRALYGTSKQSNAIHCSDSLENATRELEIFFPCHTFLVDSTSSPSSSSSSSSSSASTSLPTTPEGRTES